MVYDIECATFIWKTILVINDVLIKENMSDEHGIDDRYDSLWKTMHWFWDKYRTTSTIRGWLGNINRTIWDVVRTGMANCSLTTIMPTLIIPKGWFHDISIQLKSIKYIFHDYNHLWSYSSWQTIHGIILDDLSHLSSLNAVPRMAVPTRPPHSDLAIAKVQPQGWARFPQKMLCIQTLILVRYKHHMFA